MAQNEIEQIELSIAEAKKIVARGKKAEKLATIPEFKELILEGFMKEEVVRLANIMNDGNIPETSRKCARIDVNAGPALRRYLMTIVQQGILAEQSIEEHEMTLEELHEEAATEVHDLTGDEE